MSEEKLVLTTETYDNVLRMMNSPDYENRTVALTCLDHVDFNTNLVHILNLKKEGNATAEEWRSQAPLTSKMLTSIGINLDTILTFKQIQETLIKRNAPIDHIQLYLNQFAKHIHGSIKGLGYDFIDSLEITIKLKSQNGEQSGTISESIKGPDA